MKPIKTLPRPPVAFLLFLVFFATFVLSQEAPQAPASPQLSTRDAAAEKSIAAANGFDQVIDRTVEREHFFMAQMKQLHPLVETYLQNLKQDREIAVAVPSSDVYFLGRLDMSEGTGDRAFRSHSNEGLGKRALSKLNDMYSMKFLPLGFAQMVVLDQDFQRKFYDFTFVRREFLGEVRCIVIDVAPKKTRARAGFSAGCGSKTRITTLSASTEPTLRTRDPAITCILTAGAKTFAPESGFPP